MDVASRLGSTRLGLSRTDLPLTQAPPEAQLGQPVADDADQVDVVGVRLGDEDVGPEEPLLTVPQERVPGPSREAQPGGGQELAAADMAPARRRHRVGDREGRLGGGPGRAISHGASLPPSGFPGDPRRDPPRRAADGPASGRRRPGRRPGGRSRPAIDRPGPAAHPRPSGRAAPSRGTGPSGPLAGSSAGRRWPARRSAVRPSTPARASRARPVGAG